MVFSAVLEEHLFSSLMTALLRKISLLFYDSGDWQKMRKGQPSFPSFFSVPLINPKRITYHV